MISLINHPDDEKRLGDLLIENLSDEKWTVFRAAVAFVKSSGVKHVKSALAKFLVRGKATVSAGIDHAGTSKEGLTGLLEALGTKGVGWVFQNAGAHATFHPKVYVFENATDAECFIGSGNLTEGGLYSNYETFVRLRLHKAIPEDQAVLAGLETILRTWTGASGDVALKLSPALIQELAEKGLLPTEAQIAQAAGEVQKKVRSGAKHGQGKSPFGSKPVRRAPRVAGGREHGTGSKSGGKSGGGGSNKEGGRGFVMTLQQTDVGKGQTTKGTSKRSPEIFIPLVAVREDSQFWGWPALFVADPKWTKKKDRDGRGKMDRLGVRMKLASEVLNVHWWYNPDKGDLRLRSSALRSTGKVGDLILIEKPLAATDCDYKVRIVRPSDADFDKYDSLCNMAIKQPSKKRYGYY